MMSKASVDLPEPDYAGDHREGLARNLHVDVAQVVLARAVDDDGVARCISLGAAHSATLPRVSTGVTSCAASCVLAQRLAGVGGRMRFDVRGRAGHDDLRRRHRRPRVPDRSASRRRGSRRGCAR